ncbi:hypothetical protein, conserved [Trypanosoma brucei gambiense DAL972]|uniref:Uncharacterized protein n=1 Tax=Trypanosoma brucei gambiense (strain MHOM/CI/86/DAL972) TaxID=679716 RepID=D0A094_TRYB9|nr:hypothetical protein, conserved [Trypanosoma brucei gambiense DAL972]CBH16652.1 hypothetical protein, conserved [Trypanosoma brucei gambiense DAL972]|eukprot:XP_011778916.1 hypothetical protein, conserved [Trypanosoma brucei gambiense DAL972]
MCTTRCLHIGNKGCGCAPALVSIIGGFPISLTFLVLMQCALYSSAMGEEEALLVGRSCHLNSSDGGGVCHGFSKRNVRRPLHRSRQPLAAHNVSTVYKLGNIVCRGTCDSATRRGSLHHTRIFGVANRTLSSQYPAAPSRDGEASDDMLFEISKDRQSLRLRLVTSIGNMAVRFVTFEPLRSITNKTLEGGSLLTSASVPTAANPSFNTSCLDRQGRDGSATTIWKFDDRKLTNRLDTQSDAYKSGENYYHKFGGNHRDCDVYRLDPCKYAPMLTPPGAISGGYERSLGIHWKLHINDCDATWIGDISLNYLLQMRNSSTGEPLFTLLDGNILIGSVYLQVVEPVSWSLPSKGVVFGYQPYNLRLQLQSTTAAVTRMPQALNHRSIQSGTATSHERIGNKRHLPGSSKRSSSLVHDVKSPNVTLSSLIGVWSTSSCDNITGRQLYSYNFLVRLRRRSPVNSTAASGAQSSLHTAAAPRVTGVEMINSSLTVPIVHNHSACPGEMHNKSRYGELPQPAPVTEVHFERVQVVGVLRRQSKDSEPGDDVLNVSATGRVVTRSTKPSVSGSAKDAFVLRILFEDGRSDLINIRQGIRISGFGFEVYAELCRLPLQWWSLGRGGQLPLAAQLEARSVLEDVIRGRAKKGNGCTTEGNRSYGSNDRVHVSLNVRKTGDVPFQVTKVSLHRLVLSVDAAAVSGTFRCNRTTKKGRALQFLLDSESHHRVEKEEWVNGEDSSSRVRCRSSSEYASLLHYRRTANDSSHQHADLRHSPSTASPSFSFIPGALIRRGFSGRVEFHLKAVLRVSENDTNSEFLLTEGFRFTVEASPKSTVLKAAIPSPSGDDNSTTAGNTQFVTISKGLAVVLYVVLTGVIAAAAAVGLLLEWRFHMTIKALRRRMSESAVPIDVEQPPDCDLGAKEKETC